MIVPMNKYSFLVYHGGYDDFLNDLRKIGVLHIEQKHKELSPEIQELYRLFDDVRKTIKKLNKIEPAENNANLCFEDGRMVFNRIKIIEKELDYDSHQRAQAEKELKQLEPWGSFEWDDIQVLENRGIKIRFYVCRQDKFNPEWEEQFIIREISTVGNLQYFVRIDRDNYESQIDDEIHGADEITPPKKTLAEVKDYITNLEIEENELNEEIRQIATHCKEQLVVYSLELYDTITQQNAKLQTSGEVEGKVDFIEGWVPETHKKELDEYLEKHKILYVCEKPGKDEKVPVLLKNNRFTRMFEFIGELYDLPNYNEADLTPLFAPFYMLFFGLCLGDAGYGLVFLIAGLILRKKMKNPVFKSVMTLVAWLGVSTIIMGTISGTFFGFSLIDSQISWLKPLQKFMLDSNKLFYNALLLGVVQVIFGIVVKFVGQIKRFGFLSAIPTLGWLLIILGCGGTLALSMFGMVQPETAKWLYIIFGGLGALCVFILNDIKRNPLFNIGSGLWDTYNMATGILGDVLSYIRIFALGLSGGVMGLVFNDLAINMSGNIPVLSTIIMLLIMLFGHSINIFINGIGAFVHPMRLTFVEFYKNAGFEGGGKKYRPFATYKEETKVL